MKVAVCYTKRSPQGIRNCDAFAEGVMESGDSVCIISNIDEIGLLSECDVAVQCCIQNRHGQSPDQRFRGAVEKLALRRIVIDGGCVRGLFEAPDSPVFLSIGVNGIKREAQYFNTTSPPERWNQLGIQLRPWRSDGRHILLLGQTQHGYGTQHLSLPINKWFERIVRQLRGATDRPIVFRPHPDEKAVPSVEVSGFVVRERGRKLKDELEGAWCCVAKTTNAVVEAIVRGIPVVTDDPLCLGYPVASHDFAGIENPATPERAQWAYDLAYTQWSIEDLRQGLPWRHFRPHLTNKS
jgi:hypothetical protein